MNHHNLTEKYYDRLSQRYDEATEKEGAWTPPMQLAQALRRLQQPYRSLLAIGVGTGRDLSSLDPLAPVEMEGIDISQHMLAICEKKYPGIKLHKGNFMTYDKFCRPQFDVIVCSGTLEFIPEFESFFGKCATMLSENGTLLATYEPLIFGHAWQQDAESDTMGALAEKSGFIGFRTFRRSAYQFEQAILKAGLQAVEHYSFVAYKKLESDIIYNFAACKKLSALPTNSIERGIATKRYK